MKLQVCLSRDGKEDLTFKIKSDYFVNLSLDEPIGDIMDIFGNEFVSYISNYGYDRVLRILYVKHLFFLVILKIEFS